MHDGSNGTWDNGLISSKATDSRDYTNLRVLIANQDERRLDGLADVVERLGHAVVVRQRNVASVAESTRTERPDVALVGLGDNGEHALGLIDEIVSESACPVILVLDGPAPVFVRQAARSGIFAYITADEGEDGDGELAGTLDIVLRRFAEFHNLEGAFSRRRVIEIAKGILMERHRVDDREAFELLRTRSRSSNRRVVDIAQAVVDGFLLLPAAVPPATVTPEATPDES